MPVVKAMHWNATVLYEEVVLAQGFEFAPLLSVLERRGPITRGKGLEEVERLKNTACPGKKWEAQVDVPCLLEATRRANPPLRDSEDSIGSLCCQFASSGRTRQTLLPP